MVRNPNSVNYEEEACIETSGQDGSRVSLRPCSGHHSQKWTHDKSKNTIVHQASGKCLDTGDQKSGDNVLVNECNENKDGQKWTMQHYLDK
ncbi:hypothetical protein Btru_052151 [Bulinus truncatus]|nr:hypothetical protein Btru_052151 [Bulinus truncatus]